jgi:hypothetical protein
LLTSFLLAVSLIALSQVGDATYDGGWLAGPGTPRMMLHSQSLRVSLPARGASLAQLISAETPDPFPVDEVSGELQPLLQTRLSECKASVK